MEEDVLYQVALTRTPGIGAAHTKKLVDHFGSAKAVFHAEKKALGEAKVPHETADRIASFHDWATLENELALLEKKGIRTLFSADKDFPKRLLHLPDIPPLLYYKGKADLNTKKIIAIVGTRGPSEYGRQITDQLIRQLAQPELLIISGLAYGIDACAHMAALKNNIPTIGILGHGLAHIYPHEHTRMAGDMLAEGGLLTSFSLNTRPEPWHFPMRNNLVAGLCDALLVIETGKKGGSLLTVEKAHTYHKKVFAIPGRLTDHRSAGCNSLIQQGKAEILLSGQQLQAGMGWEWPAGQMGAQARLPFPDSTRGHTTGDSKPQEKLLLKLLTEAKSLSLDELSTQSQLDISAVAIHLLNLELQGLISPLPGQRYRLS
ncbi:MAG TPA: DNA-processing protein DprA [Puia sp.]|jgi:DNA processing protein